MVTHDRESAATPTAAHHREDSSLAQRLRSVTSSFRYAVLKLKKRSSMKKASTKTSKAQSVSPTCTDPPTN